MARDIMNVALYTWPLFIIQLNFYLLHSIDTVWFIQCTNVVLNYCMMIYITEVIRSKYMSPR